jgi:molybdate transport system ATP-binding protein
MTDAVSLKVRLTARIGSLVLEVELDTAPGTLVIVGPNGAGKSSLLHLVLGVRTAERGRVTVGDEVLLDTEAQINVPLEQRRLAYVPQNYALFPHLSVEQNLEFALLSAAENREPQARKERIQSLLRDLGLSELAQRKTQSLSGGEQQRVALARALSVRPKWPYPP